MSKPRQPELDWQKYTSLTLATRLHERTARGSDAECWEWQGCRDKKGYGRIGGGADAISKSSLLTNRVAWALANNAAPPSDMLVIHSCDNPPCVNPAHLSLGDAKENTRQMMERERNGFNPSIGERNGNSKLTSEDVFYIKTALSRGIPGAAIGRCFGVKKETINSIARGLTWRSITIGDKN